MRGPWVDQSARCGPVRSGIGQSLLTEFGTLVCWDAQAQTLSHRSPAALDGMHPVYWRRADHDEFVADVDGRLEQIDPRSGGPRRPIPVPIQVIEGMRRGDVAFQLGESAYLSARLEGGVLHNIPALNTWESFLPVSPQVVSDLIDLTTQRWIVRAQEHPAPPVPMAVVGRDQLSLGGNYYRLSESLPVREPVRSGSGVLSAGLLVRDGWKVDEIVRFAPLVAFVLLGLGARAEQLRIATHSLAHIGEYDGDVLVMTDLPTDFVRDLLPKALRDKAIIRQAGADDKMDQFSTRYLVGDLPEFADYQPVICTDTDVVFDAPLLPILHQLALQSKITAQAEIHSLLSNRESVGSALFAEDPASIAGLSGFNAGLMGLPNLHQHGRTLRTIRRTLAAHAAQHGRLRTTWVDQPVANYVMRKLDVIEHALFTAATRIPTSINAVPDAQGAAGFMHFWSFAGDPEIRARGMRAYYERVCEHLSIEERMELATVSAR
jgi:hypothetical protein